MTDGVGGSILGGLYILRKVLEYEQLLLTTTQEPTLPLLSFKRHPVAISLSMIYPLLPQLANSDNAAHPYRAGSIGSPSPTPLMTCRSPTSPNTNPGGHSTPNESEHITTDISNMKARTNQHFAASSPPTSPCLCPSPHLDASKMDLEGLCMLVCTIVQYEHTALQSSVAKYIKIISNATLTISLKMICCCLRLFCRVTCEKYMHT